MLARHYAQSDTPPCKDVIKKHEGVPHALMLNEVDEQADDFHVWLQDWLMSERVAVLRHIEARHAELLLEYRKHLPRGDGGRGKVPREQKAKQQRKKSQVVPAGPAIIVEEDPIMEQKAKGGPLSPSAASELGGPSRTRTGLVAKPFWEMTPFQQFQHIINGKYFEIFIACVILANAFVLAMQLQMKGHDLGHAMALKSFPTSSSEAYYGVEQYFSYIENGFLCIFITELVCRFIAKGFGWFFSAWNYLDFVCVSLASIAWLAPDMIGFNPTMVRLARFAKLINIVRVMRSNSLLESLKLLVASIQASVTTLFWALCIIFLMQSMAGMFLMQTTASYIEDEANPVADREAIFLYFGTFWRSMLTMFEISFANWAVTSRLLFTKIDVKYGFFFVVYRCMIGFAVLSVVQSVFIQQTIKSAQLDDDFVVQQKNKEKAKYKGKLTRMFKKLDESGDGYLDRDEFGLVMEDPDMRAMLSALEVDFRDLDNLWSLLVGADGQVSPEEFMEGLVHIKGSAKALDMVNMMAIIKRIDQKVESLGGKLTERQQAAPRRRRVEQATSSSDSDEDWNPFSAMKGAAGDLVGAVGIAAPASEKAATGGSNNASQKVKKEVYYC